MRPCLRLCSFVYEYYFLIHGVDFDQTCIYTLLGGGKRCLDFRDPDLIFKVTLALLSGQISTNEGLPYVIA